MNSQKPATLGTSRLEAFSDGVFSIAITLLVLNIHIPSVSNDMETREFINKLLEQWPEFVCYVLSFVIVGIYWVGHHNTFHYIKRSDRTLLWINILFLMCIVFIPFPTNLIGLYSSQQIVIIIYDGTLVVTGLVLQLLWWYATQNHRLVEKEIDPLLVQKATRRNLLPPLIYSLAIAVSFFSKTASLVFLIVVPVLYIFPGRIDRYWSQRRSHQHPHQEADTAGENESTRKNMQTEAIVSSES